jgi:hypothetical protein
MRYRFQVSSADKVGPGPTYSIFSLTLASGCAVLLTKGSVEIDLGNGCLCEAGLVEVVDNQCASIDLGLGRLDLTRPLHLELIGIQGGSDTLSD